MHLAFLITGNASRETTRAINVDGTLNVFRAAAAAGAQRFVYASSVAAYGFGADIPDRDRRGLADPAGRPAVLRAGEGGARGAARRRGGRSTRSSRSTCCARRSCSGPNAVGAKDVLPGPLAPLGRRLFGRPRRLPFPVPVLAPEHPMQFIHEEDVGRALLQCVVGAGPPGAYNIAGDGVVTAVDVAREFGALPIPVPAAPGAGRGARDVPAAVPAAGRRVGRGGQPPGDHGHQQGPRAARAGTRATRASRRCATPSRRPPS